MRQINHVNKKNYGGIRNFGTASHLTPPLNKHSTNEVAELIFITLN